LSSSVVLRTALAGFALTFGALFLPVVSSTSGSVVSAASTPTCNTKAPIEQGGPHSHLTGPIVTVGNELCDAGANNAQVILKGIVENSLVFIPIGDAAIPRPPTASEINVMHQEWGANFIRVQLSAQFVDAAFGSPMCGQQVYDPNYLSDLNNTIAAAEANGMLVLLDLVATNPNCAISDQQVLASGGGTLAMPGPDVEQALSDLSERYGSQKLVAFELYNEPHVCQTILGPESALLGSLPNILCESDTANSAIWANGGMVTDATSYYAPGMNQLYATARSHAPQSLIFIDANMWSTDTYSFAAGSLDLSALKNTVFALHYYPCTAVPCQASLLTPSFTMASIKAELSANSVVQQFPVVFDEFGYPQAYPGDSSGEAEMSSVVCYLNKTQLSNSTHGVGWAAFTWDGYSDASPGAILTWELLSSISGSNYVPNADGIPIQQALAGNYKNCSSALGYS
jgi:hypothetical protein